MLKTRQNKNATKTQQNATLFEGYGTSFWALQFYVAFY
jgi:hypothetical protein